jgi:hypothetical protein
MLLLNALGVECLPMEASCGSYVTFAVKDGGRGYGMRYAFEPVDLETDMQFVRVTDVEIVRDAAFDLSIKDAKRFRMRFYDNARHRIDPFEFAWLLSRYEIEVVAKADSMPLLFVKAASPDDLWDFTHSVNTHAGVLVFESVVALLDNGATVDVELE